MSKTASLQVPLTSLSEDVSGRMPEDSLGLSGRVIEVHHLQGARSLERSCKIPELSVDFGDDDLLGESFGDGDSDVEGSGLPRDGVTGGVVGEGDGDGDSGLL